MPAERGSIDSLPREAHFDPQWYAATPSQEDFWLLSELSGSSVPIAVRFRLVGDVEEERLEAAIREVVARHEALRTTLHFEGAGIVQRVRGSLAPDVRRIDLTSLQRDDARRTADREHRRALAEPFDYESGPMLRARLARIAAQELDLTLVIPHVAGDGRSLQVIANDVGDAYHGRAAAKPMSYRRAHAEVPDARVAGAEAHWASVLATIGGSPGLRRGPTPSAYAVKRCRVPWTADELAGVDRVARQLGTTKFAVLAAAVAVWACRRRSLEQVVVTTPVTLRASAGSHGAVGPLINTIPLVFDAPHRDLRRAVEQARSGVLGGLEHRQVPYRAIRALAASGAGSEVLAAGPMISAQPDLSDSLRLDGCRVVASSVEQTVSDVETAFLVAEDLSQPSYLEHAADLLSDAEAQAVARAFSEVVAELVSELAPRARAAAPAGAAMPRQVMPHPRHLPPVAVASTVVDDDLVRPGWASSRLPAIVDGDGSLSYADLDERSRRLAWALVGRGLGRGRRVGVMMAPRRQAFVVMLAVLRAGAAYVPLDPAYPQRRLEAMARDAGLAAVIADDDLVDRMEGSSSASELAGSAPAADGVPPAPRPQDLAYVVFTSGSTGTPKPIAVPHRVLANLAAWQHRRSAHARTLQFTSLSFDVSLQETFSTWRAMQPLVLLPESGREDLLAVARRIASEDVERVFLPYVALREIARVFLEYDIATPALREVVVMGERLVLTDEIVAWLESLPGVTLDNQYGPAETHITNAHRLDGAPGSWPRRPPIGAPIPGVWLGIADPDGDGIGQIVLGGVALSDGYLGRGRATAERFVPAPGRSGERMYLTGDYGWIPPDGEVCFAGRRDEQVKVRGYRVELGEVDYALTQVPGVLTAASAVLDSPTGTQLGCAVTRAPGAGDLTAAHVRAGLADVVPAWMVPSRIEVLDGLRMTPTGKVDRVWLARTLSRPPRPADRREAMTGIEAALLAMWQEVLPSSEISVDEAFVGLGGDSLSAARVAGLIHERLGLECSPATILERETIEALAAVLSPS